MSPSPYWPGPGLEVAGGHRGRLGAAQFAQAILDLTSGHRSIAPRRTSSLGIGACIPAFVYPGVSPARARITRNHPLSSPNAPGRGQSRWTPRSSRKLYEGQAPWDIGEPQPEIVRLAEAGAIQGVVLDVGCGTGENALYLAGRGLRRLGHRLHPEGDRAGPREGDPGRGLGVHFQVGDALKLDVLGRTFDTVIDSGLFHTFGDEERPMFVRGLARAVVARRRGFTCSASATRSRPARARAA